MKKSIELSKSVDLPVELAGRRTAVFGISGSGKSNTATVIVEQLLAAGEQVVMIDPKGEGWGLLSLMNGKPSNLDIVAFGEPNGHIETLSENHGQRLADFVVESGRSVILSLLGFESDNSERRFVATFLRQLYRRKSRQAGATRTLVVLEEAHLFVPEHATGAQTELAGAVQRIVRQGRSCGIGTLLIDQRPQDVSKRVVTQCDTLICHQLSHNLDRKALEDWVRGFDTDGRGKAFLESLASLKPGEAWIWSPSWLNIFEKCRVNRRQTFDTGAAPDGKAAKTVKRAEVDLNALRGQLEEIVIKAKADDPKELRAKIAELQKELSKKAAPPAAPVNTLAIKNEGHQQGYAAGITAEQKRSGALIDELQSQFDALKSKIGEYRRQSGKPDKVHPKATMTAKRGSEEIKVEWHQPAYRPISSGHENGSPGSAVGKSGLRRILVAIAQRPGLTNKQIGIRACVSSKGGTFSTYMSKARTEGWIRDEGEQRYITDDGLTAIGKYETLPTGKELLNHWLAELGNSGASRILRALADVHPRAMTNEEIGEAAGISQEGGTFSTYMSKLRTLELITTNRGATQASEEFFS